MLPIKKLLAPKTLGLIALVYLLFITIAFLLPGKNMPPTGLPLDKVVHLAIHAGLVFICLMYVYQWNHSKIAKPQLFIVVFLCFVYGIIIEVVQETLIALRHADVWDLVANTIGILIGTLLFFRTRSLLENQN